MRRYNLAALRSLVVCALVLPAVVSISGCSSSAPVPCAGQCRPPYELMVDFRPGTTQAAAQQLLTSCTDNNPVVIRVGPLRDIGGGVSRAFIYTQVFGVGGGDPSGRTTGLLACLRHSSLKVMAAWPD